MAAAGGAAFGASDDAPPAEPGRLRPQLRLKRARDDRGNELERETMDYLGGLEDIDQIQANAEYLRKRAQDLFDQVQELTEERARLAEQTGALSARETELSQRVEALTGETARREIQVQGLTEQYEAANTEVGRLNQRIGDLNRELETRGGELVEALAAVEAGRTELQTVREEVARERAAVESTRTELQTTQEGLARERASVEQTRTELQEARSEVARERATVAAVQESSEAALRTLDAFSFLIGSSPLVRNLPFAIVQNWNRMVENQAGDATVAQVIEPVFAGLRVEAEELARVLQLAGVIDNVDLTGVAPRYNVLNAERFAAMRVTLEEISAMLEGWRGAGGTLAKVVAELDTVRARLRFCAARAGFDGALAALLEAGNADALRRVRDCASVPGGLLEAYLRTATMPAG